jgi:hypothetical protein
LKNCPPIRFQNVITVVSGETVLVEVKDRNIVIGLFEGEFTVLLHRNIWSEGALFKVPGGGKAGAKSR